jgi:hypothetical protein
MEVPSVAAFAPIPPRGYGTRPSMETPLQGVKKQAGKSRHLREFIASTTLRRHPPPRRLPPEGVG